MKFKSLLVPLFLIFLVLSSLALRLYRLDLIQLYADEAGHYLLFHQIQTRGLHLYERLMTFTWIFGLNAFGIRSASAIYGAIFVLVAYYFGKNVISVKVGLISALISAFLPSYFLLSRIGHTHIQLVLILTTLSLALLTKAKSTKSIIISLIPLILASYTYFSLLVITPLFVSLIFIYIFRGSAKKIISHSWLLLVVFLVILGIAVRYQVFDHKSRGMDLLISNDVNTYAVSDEKRGLIMNMKIAPFVYNKISANVDIFVKNYLSFISPDWLFLKGDSILRHSTNTVGTLYPFLLPFLLYGIYHFYRFGSPHLRLYITLWLLIAPIPAAITKDGGGYLLRAVTMVPVLVLWSAIGLSKTKTKWLPIVCLVAMYSIGRFFIEYHFVYPTQAFHSFEYGFKDIAQFQLENKNASLLLVWQGYNPDLLFRTFQNVSPDAFFRPPQQFILGETEFFMTSKNLVFSAVKSTADLAEFQAKYDFEYLVVPDPYFFKFSPSVEQKKRLVKEIMYPNQTVAFSIYKL